MQPAPEVTVRAYGPGGGLKAAWRGRLLKGSHLWAVLAEWDRPPVEVGGLQFRPGDRLIELFWTDRWWNVFRVAARGGALRGYYINLATPVRPRPVGGGGAYWELAYVDGALDAVVTPDGRWQWLDRDAFRRLVGLELGAGAGRGSHRSASARSGPGRPQGDGRGRGRHAGSGGRELGPAAPAGPAEGWHGGEGNEAGCPLPHRAQWLAAARELGRRLVAGATAFVGAMAPWDEWVRQLPPAPEARGTRALLPRPPDGEDGCGP